MKKTSTLLLCGLLLAGVLLVGCDEKPSQGGSQGSSQSGAAVGYKDALADGDYESAYEALLAGDKEADEADADKFLVLPTAVECDDRDGKFTATFTYDDKGLLTKVDIPKEYLPETIVYTYDDNGNILTKSHTKGSGDPDVTTYTYDDKGNCLTAESVYSGRTVTLAYTYDDNGRVLTETDTTVSTWNGTEVTVYTSVYDDNGNLLSRKTASGNGKEYTYDAENRLLTDIDTYGEDGPRNRRTYTYGEDGRLAKERWDSLSDEDWWTEKTYGYDTNGTQYTKLYSDGGDTEAYTYAQKFDDEGRLTEYTYVERDDGEQRVHTFDAVGNKVSIHLTKTDGTSQTYTYAYDQFGNRTSERFENQNGEGYSYVVIYEVKYYPDGAPDISDYVREFTELDSIRSFF